MNTSNCRSRAVPAAFSLLSSLGLALGLNLSLVSTSQAHMTWLLPTASHVNGKTATVAVDAVVSEHLFNFERALKLERLQITAPDGSALLPQGQSTARHRESFDLVLNQAGTYRISHVSRSAMASYLRGGELQRFRGTPEALARDVPADVELKSLTLSTNRQQTFVSKDEAGQPDFKPEGQGLELLPLSPVTELSHGDSSRFRLLLDGRPLADAKVTVLREGNRYRYKMGEMLITTDSRGEFELTWREPGRYWLGASHGERAAAGQAGSREQPLQRASLSATFEVLPR